MTRSSPRRGAPIAAAGWPMMLLSSVVLVAAVVAAPLIVRAFADDVVGASTADALAVAVGAAMLVALAVAWVLLRARRAEINRS